MPTPSPPRGGASRAKAPGQKTPRPAKAKRPSKPRGAVQAKAAPREKAPVRAQQAALRRLVAASPEVAQAVRLLRTGGLFAQGPRQQISARVDPMVLKAAGRRFGLRDTSDVINAALAVAAAPDPFKAWLRDPGATLSDDFEPAV